MVENRLRSALVATCFSVWIVSGCEGHIDTPDLEGRVSSGALEGDITPNGLAARSATDTTTGVIDENGARNFDSLRGVQRWSSAGHDLLNTRNQPAERHIGTNNVSTLTVKWVFVTEGDVWATPSVAEKALYFPDAAGNLFAVDRRTGAALWQRKIAEYTGLEKDISRTTPTINGELLILGDQAGRLGGSTGPSVIAVNRTNGDLVWATKIDDNPTAVVTQSPVVFGDRVYVGVSSLEEQYAATVAGYRCCSFRGSVVALDRRTGKVVWKTYTLPGSEAPGYAGGAVWGNTPVVDPWRGSLYVTTGNNYTVPQALLDCQSGESAEDIQKCVSMVPGAEHNYFDAVMSLDLRTGAIKWARAMIPFDSWNIACIFSVPGNAINCTSPKGEDFDFGQGATLFNTRVRGGTRQLLGAGQKSGMYWAINPDDGSVVWNTQVGPGGSLGGLEWGSAIDGTRIYSAVANSQGRAWTLSNGDSTVSGFWSALDPATGRILWQTRGEPAVKSSNQGPVSVANGVVYGGTVDSAGTMYALDAKTGKTLWTFRSGGSVNSGAAIADGVVYWGSGYGVRGIGLKPNTKLFAFVPSADCTTTNPCTGSPSQGGAGGAGGGGAAGSGGAAGGSGGGIQTTWADIYKTFLGPGTIGHCNGCHNEMGRIVPLNSASVAYDSLVSVGQIDQIDGTNSPLGKRGLSRLSWFGGDMPPNGPTIAPDAEQSIAGWVANGAHKE